MVADCLSHDVPRCRYILVSAPVLTKAQIASLRLRCCTYGAHLRFVRAADSASRASTNSTYVLYILACGCCCS